MPHNPNLSQNHRMKLQYRQNKAAYHESLASANEAPNKMKQNSIKNACGKIATKANINHAAQASKGGDMSR